MSKSRGGDVRASDVVVTVCRAGDADDTDDADDADDIIDDIIYDVSIIDAIEGISASDEVFSSRGSSRERAP